MNHTKTVLKHQEKRDSYKEQIILNLETEETETPSRHHTHGPLGDSITIQRVILLWNKTKKAANIIEFNRKSIRAAWVTKKNYALQSIL